MIPVVEDMLPEPHNKHLLTLLYRLAEWHALAKLRMHTEHTLQQLEESTIILGKELRSFRNSSKTAWTCKELPRETAARGRRAERKKAKVASKIAAGLASAPLPPPDSAQTHSTPLPDHTLQTPDVTPLPLPKLPAKVKNLNLYTYKHHALGDYVRMIRMFGTTDSYSTQIVSGFLYLRSYPSDKLD